MSETSALRYPQWQGPLQEVILEFDREKLSEKVQSTEALILERLQQLQQSSDGYHERDAVRSALALVRLIKHERLDFPDRQ